MENNQFNCDDVDKSEFMDECMRYDWIPDWMMICEEYGIKDEYVKEGEEDD